MKALGGLVLAVALAACTTDPVRPTESSTPARAVGQSGTSYIVQLQPGGNPHAVAASVGASPRFVYVNAIKGFAAELPDAAVAALERNPLVERVEPNGVVRISAVGSWGLDRVDQRALPLDGSYAAPASGGAGATVYVVDTGIWITNVDFQGRARYGIDLTPFGGPNLGTNLDCHGHGTHVAGTIGGATYGIAKQVQLVAVRVFDCFGNTDWATILAAVDWVTGNAVRPAVVNMSLGGGYFQTFNDAVSSSIATGITYVVAAGNENRDACQSSPASAPEAITVGATDRFDFRAAFSSWGGCLDLFAPGVDITSDWNGQDMWTVFSCGNSCTNVLSGTSMATPHVAGAAALLLSGQPNLTPAEVSAALIANATTGRVLNPGSGSPNRLLYVGTGSAEPPTEPPPPEPPPCIPRGRSGKCR